MSIAIPRCCALAMLAAMPLAVAGGEPGETATGPGVGGGDALGTPRIAGVPYRNTIPDAAFPVPYTEVCLSGATVQFDVHEAGEPTADGRCRPGEVGWVISRTGQDARTWGDAATQCRRLGMRLPMVLEWQLSCRHAERLQVGDITGGREWAANAPVSLHSADDAREDAVHRATAAMAGEASCRGDSWHFVATFGAWEGRLGERPFRCAR